MGSFDGCGTGDSEGVCVGTDPTGSLLMRDYVGNVSSHLSPALPKRGLPGGSTRRRLGPKRVVVQMRLG